ncbi:MAG: peptide transporter substrate-binding protein, partial [Rhizobium sp.]|nr:peptide transporter substrate-binding protein [Rhizobium sp.]
MKAIAFALIYTFVSILGCQSAMAQKPKTLRVLHYDNPPSASIHEEATISTVMPFMAVYNNLVIFDPEAEYNSLDVIVPDLASEWHWNADHTTLTFKLRDGVSWHDGKPFTSADVKCTWDALTSAEPSQQRKNPRKSWYRNLKSVAVNGPLEVTFTLGRPQPSFLIYLASAFSPVYPCHVPASQMRTRPIGTGPFKFVEFRQNESITLTRNEKYWKKGLPLLDGIEYTIIKSTATGVLAFTSNKADMTFTGVVTPIIARDILQRTPTAICEAQSTNIQTTLQINQEKPPFDDPKMRLALEKAIDRKAFVDILTEGAGRIGGAMLPAPDGIWAMPASMLESIPGYELDIEKRRKDARNIMSEAGYTSANPLKIKISTRNTPTYRDPAVILIDQLRTINISAELDLIDTGVWYTRMARKDFTVALGLLGFGVDDPDVAFYEAFACGSERNYTNYCNP